MSRATELPNDVESLKGLVREQHSALQIAEAQVLAQKLELEKLRFEIAMLKRMKYASPIATADEEHALEYVRFGPNRRWSMPIHAAAGSAMYGVPWCGIDGDGSRDTWPGGAAVLFIVRRMRGRSLASRSGHSLVTLECTCLPADLADAEERLVGNSKLCGLRHVQKLA